MPHQPPTAAFGYGCDALSCSFVDSSSDSDGSVVSRACNSAEGSTSTSRYPNQSYAAAGTCTVSLSVTDEDGTRDGITRSLNVSDDGAGYLGTMS